MSKIILLKDFFKLKEQKEKEILFYKERLIQLQDKLYWLERDLELTINIIKMIEEDKFKLIDKTT
jgi:hypothetical protein